MPLKVVEASGRGRRFPRSGRPGPIGRGDPVRRLLRGGVGRGLAGHVPGADQRAAVADLDPVFLDRLAERHVAVIVRPAVALDPGPPDPSDREVAAVEPRGQANRREGPPADPGEGMGAGLEALALGVLSRPARSATRTPAGPRRRSCLTGGDREVEDHNPSPRRERRGPARALGPALPAQQPRQPPRLRADQLGLGELQDLPGPRRMLDREGVLAGEDRRGRTAKPASPTNSLTSTASPDHDQSRPGSSAVTVSPIVARRPPRVLKAKPAVSSAER